MASSDPPPPTAPERASTLDARSKEIIGSVVRVLARSGCNPRDIAAEAEKTCREVSTSWVPPARVALSPLEAAGHVLTLWFCEAAYTDARGKPRPLPVRGERSLEALVLQVDASLEVDEVLGHLLPRGVLRRHGTRYVPRRRVLFVGGSGPYHVRVVDRVAAMLRTLEHNSEPGRTTPKWYERVAANARFPVSQRAEFDKRLRESLDAILARFDAEMHEKNRRRKKGEPTVGLQIGVYVSEYEPSLPEPRATRERRQKKNP